MEIEVLIPTLAGRERLREVLGALRSQTLPPAVRVIDNGGDDPTGDVLDAFDEVRVIRPGRNLGFGAALNRGVAESSADLVVFLNDDAVPDREFLERIAATRSATGAAMIAGCLVRPDGSIDSAGVDVDRSLIAYDLYHGEPYGSAAHRGRDPLAPSGGAAGFDRRSFLDVGGFDERFFAYLEDVDLGLRMTAAGFRCASAYDAHARHDHSATLGSGSLQKNRLMGRSRGYLLHKYRDQLGLPSRARGLAIDAVTYAGQMAIDRNAGAIRGRLEARRLAPAGGAADLGAVPRIRVGIGRSLRIRLSRRRRV